ncbi:hypothetical protein [Rodentibacter caecimuris]|uniref:hypothetical protein n=1 Tax=Rodentibacter caecimuris TaxID=1796644 RepID=UPI00117B163F
MCNSPTFGIIHTMKTVNSAHKGNTVSDIDNGESRLTYRYDALGRSLEETGTPNTRQPPDKDRLSI